MKNKDKNHKGRFDLLPCRALTRLALRYEYGTKKYEARRHESGILKSVLIDKAFRHLVKYMKGDNDEDHLIASVWNLMHLAEQEELIKEGKLNKKFDDI